ncbi:MAG: EutN/CcmL family microcompartment protein [Ruminiclostridium sp.]
MFIAKVVGNVVSSVKSQGMEGAKLLLVQPLESGLSEVIIAVDCIGAGIEEMVLVVHEGGSSKICYNTPNNRPNAPVDAVIVGVIDDIYKVIL